MAVTKKPSTAPVKKVKVDNSAAAKKERKEAAKARKPKLAQIRQKARQDYKSLTPQERQHLAERNIFTSAIRHGASESDAKAEVLKYRKRIKMKKSGKHATAARKALHDGTRELRQKLKSDLSGARDALKKAREHNKSIKDPKKRANANAKAKDAYQKTAGKIAAARAKAVEAKKNKLKDIHENMQKLKKVFKKPTTKKGVRLVSAEKAAAAPAAKEAKAPKGAKAPKHKETAAQRKERKAAEKAPGYGPQISKNRLTRRNNEAAKKAAEAPAKPAKAGKKAKAEKAPAAPAPEVKAKRKYTRKPKEGAAAPAKAEKAAKPAKAEKVKVAGKRASKMGPNDGPQISKNRLTRRNNEAAKKAAEAPAKPAKAAKAPKAPKASTKPAAKAPAAKAPKAPAKTAAKKPAAKAPAAAAPEKKAASGGIRRR
jgi:hypothetical protein